MEVIKYKQVNRLRRRWFIIVYFTLLAAFAVYTFSNDAIINFINHFHSIIIGLLAGIIFLSPLLLMTKLTSYDVTLKLNDEGIRILDNNKEIIFNYLEISKMYLNRHRPNELELWNVKNTLLYVVWPSNNGDVIEDLISLLVKRINFYKEKKAVKTRGAHYDSITYIRMKDLK